MGKRHFKGNNHSQDKKRRRENAENWANTRGDDRDNNRNTWAAVTDNERFQAYYRAQRFVEDGADWDSFIHHLRQPLPACFRINPDYAFADKLRSQLLGFVGKTISVDDQEIQAVEQIPWYPNGHGYKLGTDRRSIRKLGALTQLHKWMVQHTDNGNITRQEAVSMIPPLALNVSPNHKCLDMCAAPGSKTSQLLEIVNRSLSLPVEEQGLVVANDSDTDRAYMLVHQCKRINSPLLIVTTHKGQLFPSITDIVGSSTSSGNHEFFDRVLCDVPCSGDGTLRKNPTIWGKWQTSMGTTLHPLQLMIAQRGLQLLKAEGLMVYSTCSLSPYENEAVVAELLRANKGTLELVDARQFLPLFKARAGLSKWHVLDDYLSIKKLAKDRKHEKMVQKRAEKKIKAAAPAGADGEAVASTETGAEGADNDDETPCATNEDAADEQEQEEDEEQEEQDAKAPAIDPSRIINIDYSDVTDPYLLKCIEMGMTYYSDHSKVPEHMLPKVRKSFFSPTEEEAEWMHLERCLRCVPQDEDTGGFFVATLRKIAKPPKAPKVKAEPVVEAVAEPVVESAESAAEVVEGETSESAVVAKAESRAVKPHNHKGLVDFHQWDLKDFTKMKAFYGLDDTLPADSMFVREDFSTSSHNAKNKTASKSKSVYFIPHSARALMYGDRDARLKIVTAGVKMFERKDLPNGEHDYRILQEGISFIAPHISNRKINVSIQDFCNILGGGLVSFSTLSPATVSAVTRMQQGVIICIYEYNPADVIVSEAEASAPKEDTGLETPVHVFYGICWRGGSRTLNVMAGKVDIESMKHQLEALNVLRQKVNAVRIGDAVPAAAAGDATGAEITAETADAAEGQETAEMVVEEQAAEAVAVENA